MEDRIGPYRITERLGVGGMGEVFKAFDDRLDRWVAIKRIRPGKEDTDENRERFQREARATARLNHSSIVHVYDIFRDGESDCIVMEYVEGRSLQTMAAEGPLDPVEAAALGQEIAEGLAEAHSKGILHRDLKTENIIVTPEGHAKILDFGLAKPLLSNELDPNLTGKGQLVGTSRSMSPEYVSGDEVDHRSDLFALGVLLYEVVTGRSPFKGQNTLATLKQVIIHQQPPARDLNADVSQELSDLIDRLLEKAPDERPQSAKEVASELGRICGQPSSGSISRDSGSHLHPEISSQGEWSISTTMIDPRFRRLWIALGVFVVAALAAAFILGRRLASPPIEFSKEDAIVLGKFENLTDEAVLDLSLDAAFRTGLEQSEYARVLSPSQVQDALLRMELEPETPVEREIGIELALREGAKALVIGEIIRIGKVYTLSAEIIDPQTKETVFTTPATEANGQDAILGALGKVAKTIRGKLGESLAAIESTQPLERVTTRNFEALKNYSLGLEKIYQSKGEEAIPFLRRAVSLDPEFAMAHARLFVIFRNAGEFERALEHIEAAIQHADRLTQFERYYLEGWMANREGSTEEMVRAWTSMSTLQAGRRVGLANLGLVYFIYLGQFEKAKEALEEVLDLTSPELQQIYVRHLAYCYLALGEYEEALEKLRLYELDISSDVGFYTYLAMEQYDHALELAEDEDSYFYRALIYADQGRFDQAFEEARRGTRKFAKGETTQNGIRSRLEILVAEIAYLTELDPERQDLLETIETDIEELWAYTDSGLPDRSFHPSPALAMIGKVSARHGHLEIAQEILDRINENTTENDVGLFESYRLMLEGEIKMAEGHLAAASSAFTRAIEATNAFQVHESLGQAQERAGNLKAALDQLRWLEEHRGQALAECFGGSCWARAFSLTMSTESLFKQAQIYEELGNTSEAIDHYRRFVEHWGKSESPPPSVLTARERLEALAGETAGKTVKSSSGAE